MHHPDGVEPGSRTCDCRKPKPGMLLEAAAELELELAASWMVGDSDTDVEAGPTRAAARFSSSIHSAHRRDTVARVEYRAADLGEAVAIITAKMR